MKTYHFYYHHNGLLLPHECYCMYVRVITRKDEPCHIIRSIELHSNVGLLGRLGVASKEAAMPFVRVPSSFIRILFR